MCHKGFEGREFAFTPKHFAMERLLKFPSSVISTDSEKPALLQFAAKTHFS
jgi:hypothetical protein